MLDDIKSRIHQYFISKTDFLKVKDKMSEDELRTYVLKAINDVCEKEELEVTQEEKATFVRELVSAVISFGPIRPLMEDNSVSEIMINGPRQVYVQKKGRIEQIDIRFPDNDQLYHMIHKILAASASVRR